ncbi:MAG: Hsp70 family protein, partial [Sphingobacteriales bacterium]|nr:Hsp70 family protein [Sphingobacteriales bacterium]
SDKIEKEKVEKINQADSQIFQTEKQLKEYGDKISADKKEPIETALAKVKEAHKLQDIAAIDTSVAELNAAWTAASEEIYKAQAATGAEQPQADATTGGGQPNTGEDHVEDAQFEEVK